MTHWYHRDGKILTLTLHIRPGAKHSEVAGLHGNALKIRLAAAPMEGRANAALLEFVAELFAVPLRDVQLRQGAQSRHKVVTVSGSRVDPAQLLSQDGDGSEQARIT